MKHVLFATVAVLGLATAIPAFADSGDSFAHTDSANSFPLGFYNNTPFGIHAQIVEQHFANEGESSWLVQRGVIPPVPPHFAVHQAKPVAKDANGGGLSHIDILSYMLGRPAVTAG